MDEDMHDKEARRRYWEERERPVFTQRQQPAQCNTGAPVFMSLLGVGVVVATEQEMRALILEAGGSPDEWETTVVFKDRRGSSGMFCSQKAMERLKTEIKVVP